MVLGKKVRSLRRRGIIPCHLYGQGVESQSLQVPLPEITTLLRTTGRNTIIDLQVPGEAETRSVMLRGVQRNPVTDEIVHIDFFQISLTEKLRADVPLVLKGEAPAVSVFGGVLLQSLDHITVQALPSDIPSRIEVDVTGLDVIDAAVHVSQLPVPATVELLTEPELVVAKVEASRLAAEVEAEAAAAAEVAAAAAAGEEAPAAAEAAAAEEAAGEEKTEESA
jgi:large subunit ribosomal protein L25